MNNVGGTLAESGVEPIAAMLPEFDFAGKVLIPGLSCATSFRGMFGYFTSGVLVQLAPGLAHYLNRKTEPVRLVVGPAMTDSDIDAIRTGVTSAPDILDQRMLDLLGSREVTESALAHHALTCLAWLLATARMDVKVAFATKRYHPKVWLLSDRSGTVCARGSANATAAGLAGNVENLDVDCSWLAGSAQKVERFVAEFEAEWADRSQYVSVYPLSDAVRNDWMQRYKPDAPPGPEEFASAHGRDVDAGILPTSPGSLLVRTLRTSKGFSVPAGLNWRDGLYAHQGEAVEAFEQHGRRGVIEMATGAGKTITALVAAHRTFVDEGSLLIVVVAPTTALVLQWAEEARRFGLEPVLPTMTAGKQEKYSQVDAVLRRLKFRRSRVECLIATQHLATEETFQQKLSRSSTRTFLIGDEVHNLGAERFASRPPELFTYRLGLSATPVRQYDPVGTHKLFEYFGGVVYQFGLDRAIGVCLVPYDYFVHEVELQHDELEQWYELTSKIRANLWRAEEEQDDFLRRLYIQRRKIVENAASKVPILQQLVADHPPSQLRHALVYASSKNPQQLVATREALRGLNVRFHQVTEEESSDRRRLESILAQFREGILQALLAKRVLDEGVDIPEIRTAYILASTTVEREWVQRRGRVLRIAPGKEYATIHDFVVLPPPDLDSDDEIRSLLRGELERMEAFGRLARNHASRGGPVATANSLIVRYFVDRS